MSDPKPRVIADGPLDPTILEGLDNRVELLPWETTQGPLDDTIVAFYTYGHLRCDGPIMDLFPNLKVISNYGVGVDHINVPDAAARGIPVGNTPNILDGATADMGMALLLAAGRRLVEGDHYARSPEFLRYDPGFMHGREIHSKTLGIIGLGNIGRQVAKRAAAFDMKVIYHNRSRHEDAERDLGVEYASFADLLRHSDYVMLCCPLTDETRNLIDASALDQMKTTSTLVNVARGGVVDTDALYDALRLGKVGTAALDVTEPEPLPRDHPILKLSNLTIVPHLGSATVETRKMMADNSVENLMRGLSGRPLLHEVKP